MLWTTDEIKAAWRGAYSFEEKEGGWLAAYQYTKAQMAYFRQLRDFFYDRCFASSAKTLDFTTAAKHLKVEYRILWEGSQDSFELAINGQITDIRYVKELAKEGVLEFALPGGDKRVTLYLPADATVELGAIETDGAMLPAKPGTPVLWLGDSITQGYGPLRSGMTYVSVANRQLGWDVLNLGIGGYVYDAGSVQKMSGYQPEKIVVALGTNQYRDEDMTPVRDFYRRLTEIWGNSIPILCVTPLWREGTPEEQARMKAFTKELREIVAAYPQVKVADGFSLVPHLNEYFLDGLHPNPLGCEVYGRNLAKAIREMGF